MADDEQQVLEAAKKLPIAERVAHANWKVRSAAFEDIKKSCDSLFQDGDPILDQHGTSPTSAAQRTRGARR